MELKTWLLYLVTEIIFGMTPGPAVLLVSMQGLKYGISSSNLGSLGISSGNLLYFILSAFGLGALILATGDLFDYIKIAGAVYLILSGIKILYHAYKKQNTVAFDHNKPLSQHKFHSYLQGFITQVANPKAIIFFVALLPQFMDTGKNMPLQFMIFGLTTLLVETCILMIYGGLAARSKKMIGQTRTFHKWMESISGFVLIGLGINLFFMKKNM